MKVTLEFDFPTYIKATRAGTHLNFTDVNRDYKLIKMVGGVMTIELSVSAELLTKVLNGDGI